MKLLFIFLIIAGCKKPLTRTQSQNPEFKIDFLFEHEGCRVYRFQDSGDRYFTNCSRVEWTEVRSSGKTTYVRPNSNSNGGI